MEAVAAIVSDFANDVYIVSLLSKLINIAA